MEIFVSVMCKMLFHLEYCKQGLENACTTYNTSYMTYNLSFLVYSVVFVAMSPDNFLIELTVNGLHY